MCCSWLLEFAILLYFFLHEGSQTLKAARPQGFARVCPLKFLFNILHQHVTSKLLIWTVRGNVTSACQSVGFERDWDHPGPALLLAQCTVSLGGLVRAQGLLWALRLCASCGLPELSPRGDTEDLQPCCPPCSPTYTFSFSRDQSLWS